LLVLQKRKKKAKENCYKIYELEITFPLKENITDAATIIIIEEHKFHVSRKMYVDVVTQEIFTLAESTCSQKFTLAFCKLIQLIYA
jgi:hypothetical protein